MVAAIGALKGPLHGGAAGPVLDMLDVIGEPDRAAAWIEAELGAGRRIMGMGHRIYRVRDPRAAVLERAAQRLEQSGVRALRLDLARAVEHAAEGALRQKHPDRPLRANVEFYTAVLLDTVGLDCASFSLTFAVGRTAGWSAHVLGAAHSPGVDLRPHLSFPQAGALGVADPQRPRPTRPLARSLFSGVARASPRRRRQARNLRWTPNMQHLPLLGLVLVSASACATMSPTAQSSRDAAVFDRYRTFSVSVAEGPDAGSRGKDLQRGLGPMITGALQGKGYVSAARGDLLITVGSGQRNLIVKKVDRVGADPDGEPVVRNADVVESAIVIDAFDAATQTRVWHGADRIDIPGNTVDPRQLQIAVDRLLATFPTSAFQRALEPPARREAALESTR